jgi:3-deoxy-D-manno-octulosonic-acid transferase
LIAPRHPSRGVEIAAQLQGLGLDCALRSQGGQPVSETAVYICDTIGELGLFYRLAGVVFVGKSLVPHGGQNPIEPAKLASAILHGPHVANFADVFALLDAAGGAALVRDAQELAQTLAALFADGARLRAMARAAAQVVESQTGAVDRMLQAIEPYLPQAALERAP